MFPPRTFALSRSGSLAAPVLLHLAANCTGPLAAYAIAHLAANGGQGPVGRPATG